MKDADRERACGRNTWRSGSVRTPKSSPRPRRWLLLAWAPEVGLQRFPEWNNPEPEITLVIAPDRRIVGATLGNDVNLRDVEGRSALLLGKAKDNNGSAAVGPFIRLFDDGFSLDDVRQADLDLVVTGMDQFRMEGRSSMSKISRIQPIWPHTRSDHITSIPMALC